MKILIVGHAQHGKDTVAESIARFTSLELKGASEFAAERFIFKALKNKYKYFSIEECFRDRINHREEWFNLIRKYNENDPTKFAKELMQQSDIYVGIRSKIEFDACFNKKIFDLIVGVWNPRKIRESSKSFDINIFDVSDFIIFNNKGFEELDKKIKSIFKNLLK